MILGYDPNKVFPIMGGKSVLWKDAETAYIAYAEIGGGSSQSLQRVAERGGFSDGEFAYYFRGLVPWNTPWPTKKCPSCLGSGEIVDHEEGGIIFKCGICIGAGVVLPDELPACRKLKEERGA